MLFLHRNKTSLCLYLFVILCFTTVSAQETDLPQDSISLFVDTLTASVDTIAQPKKSVIDAEISYQAADSIVFFSNGKGFLYGAGTVNYKEIELKADYIEMDMDSAQVYAVGVADSLGNVNGNPVFKEGSDTYESRSIKYNFDTKKGYITHVVTQQGEGYVVGERTKKTQDDMLYMKDGRYTTCDNHEHPHFYLNLTKAKVKPKSWIVTGPAYLVLEDVPLPLAIPFGYFPFTDKYSSGILMPSYGDEMSRGFFLRDGGYYFALSDYFDAELRGDLYTKGSWGLKGASHYIKRYRYNGNFAVNYKYNLIGERDLPNASASKDFAVNWTHTQDPKANIYRTLSANVNFSTSSYARNDVSSLYNQQQLSENTKSSSIAYTQRFPDSPWTITTNLSANQRTSDSTINIVPSLNFAMARITPFKRQNAVGSERWYEKIYLTYNSAYTGNILAKEDSLMALLKQPRNWQNTFRQNAALSSSFSVFEYINITPSITYNDNFRFTGNDYKKEVLYQTIVEDEIDVLSTRYQEIDLGFARYHPKMNAGVSAQTKFYAFFKPLIGRKINMVRWVLTPTTGLSYSPGNFKDYWQAWTDGGYGAAGNVNFALENNVEMKWATKDSTGTEVYKKISLIDNFGLNASYNLMAPDHNLSNINANLRFKFTDKFGLSLTGSFDPYRYVAYNQRGDYSWKKTDGFATRRFPQLIGTSTSFGYSIGNNTFKKDKKEEDKSAETPAEDAPAEEKSLFAQKKDTRDVNEEGYVKFSMPWNLGFNYNLRYSRRMGQDAYIPETGQFKMEFTHDVSLNGDLTLSPKWRLSGSMSYDITNENITYTNLNITRDLHCWSLTASVVPLGIYQSYMVTIRVNSSMLQDLKYEQRGNSYESVW